MQTVLIFAELLIAVAMVICVLLQRSEGGALGIGGGGGGGMGGLFSPRGAADVMTRTTAILAFLFFLTCLGLNLLALHGRNEGSFLDSPVNGATPVQKPAAPAPLPLGPQVPKPK